MRTPTLHIHTIELKSLLIAILCHLAFIKFIFLVVTPQANEFKPAFVFLGPILVDNDFRDLTAKKANPPEQRALSKIKVKNVPSPFESNRDLSKPTFSNVETQQQKTFLKSSFLKTPEGEEKKETLEDLGIDLSVPKRIPLKLDPK